MNPIVWVKSKEKGNSITQDNIYYNNYHCRIKDIWVSGLDEIVYSTMPQIISQIGTHTIWMISKKNLTIHVGHTIKACYN